MLLISHKIITNSINKDKKLQIKLINPLNLLREGTVLPKYGKVFLETLPIDWLKKLNIKYINDINLSKIFTLHYTLLFSN